MRPLRGLQETRVASGLFVTPWTVAYQAPPSMGFSRQEPAACSFPGENARSWEALGEARPGQSSLSAGALRYRAWVPMREMGVKFLGWEDPLEKEMATHSSTLAWRIPWAKEPGRPQSMGSQRVRHD